MSKMAIYEKNEGKSDFKKSKYYRSDYVGLNMINTAIIATLLYMIIVAAIAFMNIEELMENIATMDLLGLGRDIVIWYLVFVGVYLLLAFAIYNVKYAKAKEKLKKYDDDLRKLYKICKEETKQKEQLSKENSIYE